MDVLTSCMSFEIKDELDFSGLNNELDIKEETDYDVNEPLVYQPSPTSAYIPIQIDPLKDEPSEDFIKSEPDYQDYCFLECVEEQNTEFDNSLMKPLKSTHSEEILNLTENVACRKPKQEDSTISKSCNSDKYIVSDCKEDQKWNEKLKKKSKRKIRIKDIYQKYCSTRNINHPGEIKNLSDHYHCKISVQDELRQRCSKCKGTFLNKYDFDNHIDDFDMCKFLNCKICGMVYADTDRLQIHMKRKHDILEKDFKYKCEYCDLEYDKHISLYKHVARKHSGVAVGINGLKINNSCDGINKFLCSKCKGQFESESLYKNHLDDNTICKLLNCNICGMIYTNTSNLHIHMKRKHNIIEGDFKFCCQYCGLEFMKKTTLHSHINVIHKSQPNKPAVYKCITCNAEFNLRNSLQKHIKRKHYFNFDSKERHICQFCGEICESFTQLSNHLDKLHNDYMKNELVKTNATPNLLTPDISCKNYNSLLFKTPTSDTQEPKISNHIENNLKFKCRACDQECKDLKALRSHVRRYHCLLKTPIKRNVLEKFTCEYCGVSMSSRSLSKHIQRKHAEENKSENFTLINDQRHKCLFCDYRSDAKGNIKIHERIHTKEKPYICGIENCQHRAAHSTSIKLHRLTHDPKKNMLYCNHCNFKTINKYFFKMHQKEHQTGEKRIYTCDLCPYKSLFYNSYNQHKLKHSDEKIIKCNNCFFSTKYMASLIKHKKTKHGCNACTEPAAEVMQITHDETNWQDWAVNQNISHS